MERILREDMFDIGHEQFLMLLFVMNAERDDRLDFVEQVRPSAQSIKSSICAIDRLRGSGMIPPPSAARSNRADRADACRPRRCNRN